MPTAAAMMLLSLLVEQPGEVDFVPIQVLEEVSFGVFLESVGQGILLLEQISRRIGFEQLVHAQLHGRQK
jgi:hypothetical protein